jgi:hypothetical protein
MTKGTGGTYQDQINLNFVSSHWLDYVRRFSSLDRTRKTLLSLFDFQGFH